MLKNKKSSQRSKWLMQKSSNHMLPTKKTLSYDVQGMSSGYLYDAQGMGSGYGYDARVKWVGRGAPIFLQVLV